MHFMDFHGFQRAARPEDLGFYTMGLGYILSIVYPAYADMPPSGAGGVKTTQLATLSSGMQK